LRMDYSKRSALWRNRLYRKKSRQERFLRIENIGIRLYQCLHRSHWRYWTKVFSFHVSRFNL
jgi:hypothetical protein